jgi:hypothetical protein
MWFRSLYITGFLATKYFMPDVNKNSKIKNNMNRGMDTIAP